MMNEPVPNDATGPARASDPLTLWERAQQRAQEARAGTRQGSIHRASPSEEVGPRMPTPAPTEAERSAEARRFAAVDADALQAKRDVGHRDVGLGAAICIVGIVVTWVSYASASSAGGGSYLIAWGAILFGAIRCVRGLAASRD